MLYDLFKVCINLGVQDDERYKKLNSLFNVIDISRISFLVHILYLS